MGTVLARAKRVLLTFALPPLFAVMASVIAPAAQASDCRMPNGIHELRSTHIEAVNAIRQRMRIADLAPNRLLDRIAQNYACLLARTGSFNHRGPDGSTLATRATSAGYSYCLIAENLALGQNSLHAALDDWVASPSHWANLQLRQARETGLGVAFVPFPERADSGTAHIWRASLGQSAMPRARPGRNGTLVWVQLVAKPC